MTVAIAIAICFASGYFIVALTWPNRALHFHLPLRLSLSVGFGLGMYSAIFFLTRLWNIDHLMTIDVLSLTALVVAFLIRRTRMQTAAPVGPAKEDLDLPHWLRRLLMPAFTIAVCVALYSVAL